MKPIVQRLLAALVSIATVQADEGAAFFTSQVLPILKNRCYECHSHEHKIDGGLALDSKSGWQNAEVIVPGNVQRSRFIRVLITRDPNDLMPPDHRLSDLEIAMLETWVLLGAPDPRPAPRPRVQQPKRP